MDCDTATAADVWSPERRAELDRTIGSLDLPYGADVLLYTEQRLDDHVATWSAAWQRACLTPEGPAHAATLECLRRELDATDAAVAVLLETDAESLPHADDVLDDLPSPDACAAPDLRTAEAPPSPEVAGRLDAVQRRLERVRALGRAGRYEEQRELARTTLAEAQALDDPRLVASALLEVGDADDATGDVDAAIEHLGDATWAAVAAGDDATAARAATSLVNVSVQRHDDEQARTWLRHARAIVDWIPEDCRRLAEVIEAEGEIASIDGRYEDALARHREAAAIFAEVLGPDHPDVLACEAQQGVDLRRMGRTDEALPILRRVLDARIETLGPRHPFTARAMDELAGVYWAADEHETSRELLAEALKINVAALGLDHPHTDINRGNLALVDSQLGRFDEALELGRQTIDSRRRRLGPDHPDVAAAINNQASTLRRMERHEESLAAHRRALAIWEVALGVDHPHLAVALLGIGFEELELGRPDKALAAFDWCRPLVDDWSGGAEIPHRRRLRVRAGSLGPRRARPRSLGRPSSAGRLRARPASRGLRDRRAVAGRSSGVASRPTPRRVRRLYRPLPGASRSRGKKPPPARVEPDARRRPPMTNLILAGILGLTTLLAPSQPSQNGGAAGADGSHDRGVGICRQIECTPAQKASLQKIHDGMRTSTSDERAQSKDLRAQLKTELAKPKLDEAKIRSLAAKLQSVHDEMAKARIDAQLQTAAVLTPAQRKKVADELASGHGKGRGHDGRGHRFTGKDGARGKAGKAGAAGRKAPSRSTTSPSGAKQRAQLGRGRGPAHRAFAARTRPARG